MTPKYLIVDTQEDAQRVSWSANYFPMEDGEMFRTIMECLHREDSAVHELEVMGCDIVMMLGDGYGPYADTLAGTMMETGKHIFKQLRDLGVYHNGMLMYCYHEDVNGALVLRSYECDDFISFRPQEKLGREPRRNYGSVDCAGSHPAQVDCPRR